MGLVTSSGARYCCAPQLIYRPITIYIIVSLSTLSLAPHCLLPLSLVVLSLAVAQRLCPVGHYLGAPPDNPPQRPSLAGRIPDTPPRRPSPPPDSARRARRRPNWWVSTAPPAPTRSLDIRLRLHCRRAPSPLTPFCWAPSLPSSLPSKLPHHHGRPLHRHHGRIWPGGGVAVRRPLLSLITAAGSSRKEGRRHGTG